VEGEARERRDGVDRPRKAGKAAGRPLEVDREAGVREIPPDSGAIQRGLSILKDGQHRRKRHLLAEEHLPHRLVVGVGLTGRGANRKGSACCTLRAQSPSLSPRGIPWCKPQQADPFVHPGDWFSSALTGATHLRRAFGGQACPSYTNPMAARCWGLEPSP
jgi:hypothetical protein